MSFNKRYVMITSTFLCLYFCGFYTKNWIITCSITVFDKKVQRSECPFWILWEFRRYLHIVVICYTPLLRMWLNFHFHWPFGLVSHWFSSGPGFLDYYFSEFCWFRCPYFNFYTSGASICTAHCLKHSSKIFLAILFSNVYRQYVRQHKENLRFIWRPPIYDLWDEHKLYFYTKWWTNIWLKAK